MAWANKQLERELLQSQKPPLAAYSASRRVVPLGIPPSYVKGRMPADAFRELYQNWKDAVIEKLDLDRQSFQPLSEDHGDHLSIIAPDQNPADQPLPINALSMGFSIKRAHNHR